MIELTKDKKHIIIKRDGREEPFNEEKLKKLLTGLQTEKKALLMHC
ncbi:ribonucleotide-diphosphate reductase subunit alpha [Brachyspira pilosicoli B2904]|uniref:Ribonucleotide-diphosphate reductase subunit alpha n=1 Tax=Brachyspira pilosicoli B2904 TaxID=1133568 RepID=J9UE93_BRAPL|nr:ribonucleotide-diphosphate reductase subunit alpha [Brachyspira pilosicoli]AFR70216.1 ribonucleotide-diphosphate reductase subunit alpha [Brachyspira pilosicoli B2904]